MHLRPTYLDIVYNTFEVMVNWSVGSVLEIQVSFEII